MPCDRGSRYEEDDCVVRAGSQPPAQPQRYARRRAGWAHLLDPPRRCDALPIHPPLLISAPPVMRGPPILKVGADRRVAGPHAMDLPRRAVAVLPPRADAAALKEADRPNRLPDLLLSGAARARMPSSTYTDAVRKSYFQLPSGMRTALR